jgi:hypothetical protein
MLPQLNSAQNVPVPRMIGVLQSQRVAVQEDTARAAQASTLELWLRSDSLVGFGAGNAITLWPDLSGKQGSNRDAAPGTAPILTLNVANGQPEATFDGATSNRFLVGLLPAVSSETWTVCAVSRMATASQLGAVVETANATGNVRTGNQLAQQTTTRRYHFAPAGEGTPGFFVEYAFSLTTPMLHICRYTTLANASPQIFEKAVSKAANSSLIGINPQTQYRIGRLFNNTAPFNGGILEICVYSSAFSTTEVSQFAAYAQNRYGIL